MDARKVLLDALSDKVNEALAKHHDELAAHFGLLGWEYDPTCPSGSIMLSATFTGHGVVTVHATPFWDQVLGINVQVDVEQDQIEDWSAIIPVAFSLQQTDEEIVETYCKIMAAYLVGVQGMVTQGLYYGERFML